MLRLLFHLGLIVLAVVSLAIADGFLKQATVGKNFMQAVTSLWLVGAVALYLVQILLVVYFFVAGWEFSLLGNLQVACYALVVVLAGYFYFREVPSPAQIAGVILAITGAVLINVE